jgi:hypothetical protein
MTLQNRPYIFQIAVALLAPERNDGYYEHVRKTAETNGVSADQLDRAAYIVDGVRRGGTDIDEWIRQEYIVDGWLQGYVPLDASPADPQWSTFHLAQLAEDYYRSQAQS